MTTSPPTQRAQADLDVATLKQFLSEAQLKDQSRLPPERALTRQLGMTRTQLRRGLQVLEEEGLIWRHVGKGTFLGQAPVRQKPKPVRVQDITNPLEIMEVRATLEPELARLAAYRATARDFSAMTKCVEKMKSARDWRTWQKLDIDFHRLIAKATQNELMLVMSDMIVDLHQIWGRLLEGDLNFHSEIATQEHEEILRALCDRDADRASMKMRTHLANVRQRLFNKRGIEVSSDLDHGFVAASQIAARPGRG